MDIDLFLLISFVGFFVWMPRSIYNNIVLFQKIPYSFLYPRQNKFTFITTSIFSFSGLISWIVLIAAFLMTATDLPTLYIEVTISVLFLVRIWIFLKQIRNGLLFQYKINSHFLFLLLITFLIVGFFSFFPLTIHAIWLLFLERVSFFILLILLFLFGFPSELLDDLAARKAIKKIKEQKSSNKILILGGESDEIALILKEIVKSSKSIYSFPSNILSRGELSRQILKLKKPKDILTLSINSQNTNLLKAGLHIFQPDICIIASSDLSQEAMVLNIRSFSEFLDRKVKIILPIEYESPARIFLRKNHLIYYSTKKNTFLKSGAYVDDISYKKSGIRFSLVLSSQTYDIESGSIDVDVVNFLVPAILTSKLLYVGFSEVKQFLAKPIYPKTMFSLNKLKGKQLLINGVYTTSVEKIIREVEALEAFGPNVNIIIGTISSRITKRELLLLGSNLNKIAASVILLTHDYLRPLRAGMKDKKGNSKVTCLSLAETDKLLKSAGKNEKILFLGNDLEPLLQSILH